MSPSQIFKDWWWGNTIQRIIVVAVGISSVIGAMLAVMNLAQVGEPYWFATRDFTRQLVHSSEKSTNGQLLDLEIASKETARDNAQSKLDSLEIEIKKNDSAPESIKQILNEQVRRYTEILRILNLELDELRTKKRNKS